MPVWTAFITHQINQIGWASRHHSRLVSLAHLQQYIFTANYGYPSKTSANHVMLSFHTVTGTVSSLIHLLYLLMGSDAQTFMAALEEVQVISKTFTRSEEVKER